MRRVSLLLLSSSIGCGELTGGGVVAATSSGGVGLIVPSGQPAVGSLRPGGMPVRKDTVPAPIVPGPGCPGSPYARVQDALDAGAAGDIVEVCAGVYPERLTIAGRTLTLR